MEKRPIVPVCLERLVSRGTRCVSCPCFLKQHLPSRFRRSTNQFRFRRTLELSCFHTRRRFRRRPPRKRGHLWSAENPFSDQTPDFFKIPIVKAPSFETDARCRPDPLNANEMIPVPFCIDFNRHERFLERINRGERFHNFTLRFWHSKRLSSLNRSNNRGQTAHVPGGHRRTLLRVHVPNTNGRPLELAVANKDPSGDHASLSRMLTPITSDTAESNSRLRLVVWQSFNLPRRYITSATIIIIIIIRREG